MPATHNGAAGPQQPHGGPANGFTGQQQLQQQQQLRAGGGPLQPCNGQQSSAPWKAPWQQEVSKPVQHRCDRHIQRQSLIHTRVSRFVQALVARLPEPILTKHAVQPLTDHQPKSNWIKFVTVPCRSSGGAPTNVPWKSKVRTPSRHHGQLACDIQTSDVSMGDAYGGGT